MMDDKVMKWRSSPLHRKCIFCKHLRFKPIQGWIPIADYYVCEAKDKVISDVLPDFTRTPRPFCKLFELDTEKRI
jgi:hypothetical protein